MTAVGFVFILYLAIGLYPFEFALPSIGVADNTAAFRPDGTLEFRSPGPGIARTHEPPQWLASAVATDHLDIVLRVRPASAEQYGPARIMTVSFDRRLRNLTIGQNGADLMLRLRTPLTDLNGTPPIQVAGVFAKPQWIDLSFSIRPHQLTIKVQGDVVSQETLPAQPLANWDRYFNLALGNELDNIRMWAGEIQIAQVSTPNVKVDYIKDGVLEIPRVIFVSMPAPRIYPLKYLDVQDALINMFGFIPLGFVLGLGGRGRHPFILGLLFVFSTSFIIEGLQFFTVNRQPSVDDLIMNTLGGGLGLIAGKLIAGKLISGGSVAGLFR
jgi:VanZ family protein